MRRFLIASLLVLVACRPSPERLRNGDLIFVGIPADYRLEDSMSDAIGSSTCRDSLNIIHAAIAEVKGDLVWIIDATIKRGVDRHPLDTFLRDFTLKDGSMPEFIVMRLRDNHGAGSYVDKAKGFLGMSYNCSFVPCDTARYCIELVRDSYRLRDGSYIFSEAPMNFLSADGTMPPYWVSLFALLGQEVPQGLPGTNPKAMMAEACLRRVNTDILSR